MKVITFISAGAFMVISACIMQKESQTKQSELFGPKWSLKKIHSTDGIKDVSTKAFIRFNKEKNSAGGNGSCNSFGSTITIDNNNISFKDIFSTKMYCEEVQPIENEFLGDLQKVNHYEIRNSRLILYQDRIKLLEFQPEPTNN